MERHAVDRATGSNFPCPICRCVTRVRCVDTRYTVDHVYRRRECSKCGKRFSTWEEADSTAPAQGTRRTMRRIVAVLQQVRACLDTVAAEIEPVRPDRDISGRAAK